MQTFRPGKAKLALFILFFACLPTSNFSLQTDHYEAIIAAIEKLNQVNQSQHVQTDENTLTQKVEEKRRTSLITTSIVGGLIGGIGGFAGSLWLKRKRGSANG